MNEYKKLFSLSLEELEIAALLLERERYRTCVSRSYYSIYYATQAFVTEVEKVLQELYSPDQNL